MAAKVAGKQSRSVLGLLIAVVLGLFLFPVTGSSESSDDLKQASKNRNLPNWQASYADCRHRIARHQRKLATDDHPAADEILIEAENGTRLYFTQATHPVRVIEELEFRIPIKSNREGLQLLARVVLPRSLDPDTNQPITLMVGSDLYSRTGEWQTIRLQKLTELIERKVRVLRSQMSVPIDTREAFVDLVAVNVYGGMGRTMVWLADYVVEGLVSATDHPLPWPRPVKTAAREAMGPPNPHESQVSMEGRRMIIDDRPFFPSVVDGNGEALEYLRQLGFNCVAIKQDLSKAIVDEAEKAGMWLISNAPSRRTIARFPETATSDEPNPNRTASASSAHESSFAETPTIVEYSRPTTVPNTFNGILLFAANPCFGSLGFEAYGRWLDQQIKHVSSSAQTWISIETGAPSFVNDQLAAFGFAGRADSPDCDQLREQMLTAIGKGARGIWFRSRERLDTQTTAAARRANRLQLLNHELDIVQPWVASGSLVGRVATDSSAWRGFVLSAYRSELIVIQRNDLTSHHVHLASQESGEKFRVEGIPNGSEIFRVTPTGLLPVSFRRVPGGLEFNLPDMKSPEWLVAARNEEAVQYVTRSLQESLGPRTDLLLSIAGQRLDETARVVELLASYGGVSADFPLRLEDEKSKQTRAKLMARAGHYHEAQRLINGTLLRISQTRYALWRAALPSERLPTAHPCVVQFATLPMYRQLSNQLGVTHDQANVTTETFDGLDRLVRSGWTLGVPPPHAETRGISICLDEFDRDNWCLRLRAASTDRSFAARPGPDILVQAWSPPSPASAHDVVRIAGRVRASSALPLAGSLLRIQDTWGGDELALLENGSNQWHSFEMIRAASSGRPLRVGFELLAPGEAWVDDLSITIVGSKNSPVRQAGADVGELEVLPVSLSQ